MLEWLADLFGPIFAKELIEVSRRFRYYLIRIIYGSLLLLAVYALFQSYRLGRTVYDPKLMSRVGEELFMLVSIVQFFSVILFVPLFLGGSIASERSAGTLDLLFTTHLTDREIIMGKLASRLVVMLLLVLSGMPVMSLAMLFGGIDPVGPMRVTAATLLVILFVGALAIRLATTARTPTNAILTIYITLFICGVGLSVVPILSPFFPFAVALSNDPGTWLGSWDNRIFFGSFIVPIYCSILLISGSIYWLRIDPGSPDRLRAQRLEPTLEGFLTPGGLDHFLDSGYRWLSAPIKVTRGLIWKPIEYGLGCMTNLVILVVVSGWLLSMPFLFFALAIGSIAMGGRITIPIWTILFAITIYIATTNPMLDRHRGFRDSLLATPLEPREILARLFRIRRSALLKALIGAIAICSLLLVTHPTMAHFYLPTAILFTAMLYALGTMVSLCSQRVMMAFLPPLLVIAILGLGVHLVSPFFRSQPGYVYVGLALAGWLSSMLWLRRQVTPFAVSFHFLSVYGFFVAGLVHTLRWLVEPYTFDAFPVDAFSPFYWFAQVMPEMRTSYSTTASWLGAYWTAQALTLIWAWNWGTRSFDRLAGRPVRLASLSMKPSLVVERQPVPVSA